MSTTCVRHQRPSFHAGSTSSVSSCSLQLLPSPEAVRTSTPPHGDQLPLSRGVSKTIQRLRDLRPVDDGSHNESAYHQMCGAQEGRIGNQVSSTSPCKNGVVAKQDPSTQRSNLLTFSTASQSHCSPRSTTLMRSRRMSREAVGERARFWST